MFRRNQPQLSEPVAEIEDRCDRCGARALLLVQLGDGSALAFCGHHANVFAGALVPLAVTYVIDPGFFEIGGAAELVVALSPE